MNDIDDPEVAEALRRNNVAVGSRASALMIYAVMGVTVGIAMFFTGAPGLVEEQFGPDSRLWLGASAAVGGLLLAVGSLLEVTQSRPRAGWWWALAGVATLCVWGFSMATFYGVSSLDDPLVIASPGEVVPRDAVRLYVPFLYQGITLLFLLHLITLIRLGRPPR